MVNCPSSSGTESIAREFGRETVSYVSNIYKYYVAYTLALEQRTARERAREIIKEKG